MNPRYCHTSEWAFNSLKSLTYYSNQSELKQNWQIVSYVFTAAKDYKPVFVLLSSAGFVMIFETRSPFEYFVTKLANCSFSFVLNRNMILKTVFILHVCSAQFALKLFVAVHG